MKNTPIAPAARIETQIPASLHALKQSDRFYMFCNLSVTGGSIFFVLSICKKCENLFDKPIGYPVI